MYLYKSLQQQYVEEFIMNHGFRKSTRSANVRLKANAAKLTGYLVRLWHLRFSPRCDIKKNSCDGSSVFCLKSYFFSVFKTWHRRVRAASHVTAPHGA